MLWRLIVAVFELAFFLVRGIAVRLTGGGTARQAIAVTKMKKSVPATVLPAKAREETVAYLSRALAHLEVARGLRETCATRRNTLRFAPTLDGLEERAERRVSQLRIDAHPTPEALARMRRDETLVAMVRELMEERRGPLAGLLDDADALASASYAPIVDYCRQRDIALASDRTATAIDGDKLFFASIDDPAGLATIVLPVSFGTEISTWPAIAHEIAHDFFHGVDGLPQQLRIKLNLLTNVSLPRADELRAGLDVVAERAVAAWMEELFADAFGTMMLGPAYVHTMMQSFASPDEPDRALAIAHQGEAGALVYEEHPPGHVRVLAGCQLLGRIGYGKQADTLEARWRALHGQPNVLYAALSDGRWLRFDEGSIVERAGQVGASLHLQGLACLRGQPLRSIAGLDFGPREHEQARRIAERFGSSRPVSVKDPRLLVAGAVLATVAAPEQAASIYALARNAIGGVDAPVAELALRSDAARFEVGPEAAREAFIASVLLGPPRCRG